jgi:solute carrier family 25 S-adenosylmethionine transporter 26
MLAGGTAAALTTPLDVVKTRTMLSAKNDPAYATVGRTFGTIVRTEGFGTLLSGLGPRVTWISLGGAIFLGVYEQVKSVLIGRDLFHDTEAEL